MCDTSKVSRAIGALVGLAVGDALGTTLEFAGRDQCPLHTEMMGGGPFGLQAGEWTDDTSMALCLADSLLAKGRFDAKDSMDRYVRWWREGENSSNGSCFDIGITVSGSLSRYVHSGDPWCGLTDPSTSGNGSLMRLAPIPIFFHDDTDQASAMAMAQSRTTHASDESVQACEYYCTLIVEAINGESKERILRSRESQASEKIRQIARGNWKSKTRDQIESTGYVVHSLEAALWSVHTSNSFEGALVKAVNLAGDADSVGAIAGQLAGALWSYEAIPTRWLQALTQLEHLVGLAKKLYLARAPDSAI
ncbi:MAG: ADP-ribosylglycohydrolase family protein [Gammaproteobacteria bacterium]|nr:ADP-ribosylglycohydrolase family protein [Gammaproteobacteria bacterium]MYD80077.1 ADP-ribosylglycohydrolase family protein [Gammaproteobacteria bacterium]